jgi:serpin B
MLKKAHSFLFGTLIASCLFTNFSLADDSAPSQLVTDINEFAASFYSHSLHTVSPYSVFTCLSMAYVGAQGETAAQMAKALSLNVSQNQLPLKSGLLSDSLKANPSEYAYELNIANAMWLDLDTFILSDYRHAIQNEFNAKIESLNFKEAEKTVSIINEWTSNQTQGKIPRLLSSSDVSPSTRLVLTNAIYFKGSWVYPFKSENTHEAPFYVQANEAHSVKMMEQTESFSYNETDDFQLLCLPFSGSNDSGSRTACFFILPKASSSLNAIEATLNAASFKSWMEGLESRTVHVKLPLFTVNYKSDLNQSLQDMGMSLPFTSKANFSGIDGLMDLYINKVIHQAYFALDEKGVTAAAATAITMNKTSIAPHPTLTIPFIADRPFLFGIVDLKSKVVLFLGKITDPKSETSG